MEVWYEESRLRTKVKRHIARAKALLGGIALGLALAQTGLAAATGIVISNYSSLNSAVSLGGRSVFASNATVTLAGATEVLVVSRAVVLDGSTNTDGSTNAVTITRASGVGPMFYIVGGGSLTLVNLTISGGVNTDGGAIFNSTGGTLIISNCVFTGNTATNVAGTAGVNATSTGTPNGGNGGSGSSAEGGAIVSHGTLEVYYSIFNNNTVSAGSGGNGGNGVPHFVFGGNGGNGGSGGSAQGGAIVCTGPTNIFVATDFTGNKCVAGNAGTPGSAAASSFQGNPGSGGSGGSSAGGAILASGSLYMSNCLLANNTATGGTTTSLGQAGGPAIGGGLDLTSSKRAAIIENTTFYQNSCQGGAGGGNSSLQLENAGNGGSAIGGGMADAAARTILTECTLATNSLEGGTAGVSTTSWSNGLPGLTQGFELAKTAGTLEMAGTLLFAGSNSIATNTSGYTQTTYATNTQPNDFGGVTDLGYNLSSDTSVGLGHAGSIENVDPIIDTGLSAPGGVVVGLLGSPSGSTVAVLSGSPAVGVIPGIPGISFPAYDQVYQARSSPATIGAYEANPLDFSSAALFTDFISEGPQDTITKSGGKVEFQVTTNDNSYGVGVGVQWQLNGTNLTDGGRISGTRTTNLTIKSVTTNDAGTYSVLVGSTTLIPNGILTNTATLTVYAPAAIVVQPPRTVKPSPGKPVNISVTAIGDSTSNSPLTFQWYLVRLGETNAVSDLDPGITGSASSSLTLYPLTSNNFGSYYVVVSNSYAAVTSSPVSLSVPPPTLAIQTARSTPTNPFKVTGTAGALFGVASVQYQINNGTWNSTTNAAPLTNWTATVTLQAGTNTFSAYSVDLLGQESATKSITIFYTTYSQLTLLTNGYGTNRPGFANKPEAALPTNGLVYTNLVVGENYTVTAVPKANNLFSNWTGDITNNSNPLTFTMQSNMTLTANFVTNFFQSFAGTYNGLFYNSNGVTDGTAGMISNLTLLSDGHFSGEVLIAGTKYPLAGRFNVGGNAAVTVGTAATPGGRSPGPAGPLHFELTLPPGQTDQIVGTVSGADWTAGLTAGLSTKNASSAEYTMLFSSSASPAGNMPPGVGYALATNQAGTMKLAGTLADGTPFKQTVPLSATGNFPVYARLYHNGGLLFGWVSLTNLTASSMNADALSWIAPAGATALYPDGFADTLFVQGARWIAPSHNTPAIAFTNGGTLIVSNSANPALTFYITNGSSNTLVNMGGASANSLTGRIDPTNGFFSVSIGNGNVTGTGAVLQTTGGGAGFFTNSTGAGLIILEPGLAPFIARQPASQVITLNTPVNFSVQADGSPPLSYQWMMDGTNLIDSGDVSGSATSNLTINNPGAADLGSYSVVVTNQYGLTASSDVSLSIPPPTLAIQTPPPIVTMSQSYTVSGTAGSMAGVASVQYQINSGPWSSATNAAPLTNWTATVALQAGTNIFRAYSVDVLGQESATSSAGIFYLTYGALALQTNGCGTISSNFASPNLIIGSNYTVTAIPDANNLFIGWTGTITSSSSNLTFVMQSNMTLTATFVTNISLQTFVGTYNGLFSATNGITEETAGMISRLTLTSNGFFSGKLFIAGTTNSISGYFNSAGRASLSVGTGSASVGGLAVDMALTGTPGNRIVGTVSTDAGVAYLTAEPAAANQPTNQYTVLLANISGTTPPGEGYAWISNKAGTITLFAGLADGTKFSQGVTVAQAGDIPVYGSLYGNTGLLIGWVNLSTMEAGPSNNTLTWIKKSSNAATLYPGGFTNTLSVEGSVWTSPPANKAAINIPKGTLLVTNASSNLDFTVAVLSDNTLAKLGGNPPNSLAGSINPKNGLFSVTFGYGSGTAQGYGAILQSQTNGGGYFILGTNSGALILSP
jgi:hypothetical protein